MRLEPAELRGGVVAFLADRTFAVITARDADGRLRSSPLTGPAGLLTAIAPTTLAIHARLPAGDPLSGLPTGQQVGLVVVEFATRRRVRLNGARTAVGGDSSGTAEVEWDAADRPGDDGRTGGRAVFTRRQLVAGRLLSSRQIADSSYPRNPALTG